MPGVEEDGGPPPVIEPVLIEDVFVSGLTAIEDHGDWLRAEFYVERQGEFGQIQMIACRLVMTPGDFLAMLGQSLATADKLAIKAKRLKQLN